ncbi:MAG: D-alanyl-D-alanine carboxypeptidase, partial [Pseudomonadota bacterium]|nr:D-alanyl-D-alanine carboxypeptidase [Pseudomonadota bacterium]
VPLTQWDSPSLSELIRDTNKFSNNVMARQLFLALGAGGQPATIDASRNAVLAWLKSKAIDPSGLILENGSGLSRTERISATTLSALLVAAFQSPVMPEFIASLPLVGYDGTMRKRLALQAVAGHAHIKSGSLQEVRSVAGYVLAASGKRYAVVCLINHANAVRGAAAQDVLLEWLYENN